MKIYLTIQILISQKARKGNSILDYYISSSSPPVSPTAQIQEEDSKDLYVAEEQLSSEKIIERLQETVVLVDKLREKDLLETRLKEVRDLEEKLQEVDEMAEKLQEVIEEELGKEEVDGLREEAKREEEMEQEVQTQAKVVTKMVVKKSVQRFEREEDEVDELEEQIKEVFLKGLIPEEEEEEEEEVKVEVKQVSYIEEQDGGQLDAGLRKKLQQIEKEWMEELEEKSGSSDVAVTTPVVTYQMEEHGTKKKVTIVEEGGLMSEEVEDVQLKERVRKEGTWSRTETVEEITGRKLETSYQLEDPSRLDVWFLLFDRPPYKAVVKPPGKLFQLKTPLILQHRCS